MRTRSHPRGGRATRTGSDRGAAAVEFALVLPLFLLVVCGLLDFGRAMYGQVTITQAAQEGVRLDAQQSPNVVSSTKAAAPGLSGVTVTVNSSCPAGASTEASVTVSYPFHFVTPISAIAKIFGGSGLSAPTLSDTEVLSCEG